MSESLTNKVLELVSNLVVHSSIINIKMSTRSKVAQREEVMINSIINSYVGHTSQIHLENIICYMVICFVIGRPM